MTEVYYTYETSSTDFNKVIYVNDNEGKLVHTEYLDFYTTWENVDWVADRLIERFDWFVNNK
jgi:hypothetical protein